MLKTLFKISVLCIVFCVGFILVSNYQIEKTTENLTFNSIDTISKNRVGIVLGTSKYLNNGNVNLYYKYRLQATYELYSKQKIEFILISGDNSTKEYDEPSTFKNDLIDLGVPESKIYLDYAGFRTLDSMVRAKEIFGLHKFTVISQKFHNQRAVYLAKQFDINAIGYNAKNVSSRYGFKTNLREKLARVKVFIDVLLNVQPKFLGETIEIK
ncbi:ElyC/SanA/YdcF family protein [Lutibacter sp. TH_r2]|uniref:SanA/YdcF family protein n=1 Tax=Lutibacter sp. TH_r2 TaxID=3082083 RepID=UPI00295518A9|nr:ElyC/SanA/YdcF family protein [Lutibacter sp. TH_r2]MDV7188203.1 ElyC/SanA/YdcF family protein [Lutibacter sp. TH_r2]